MAQHEIAEALELTTAHVRALIVDGLLKATQARNPISRKRQFYVLPEDFEAFNTNHVPSAHVAKCPRSSIS